MNSVFVWSGGFKLPEVSGSMKPDGTIELRWAGGQRETVRPTDKPTLPDGRRLVFHPVADGEAKP